jgi:hypothetical protein
MEKFTSFAHHAHSLALIITLAEQLARSLIAPTHTRRSLTAPTHTQRSLTAPTHTQRSLITLTHTQRSLIMHTSASQKRAAPAPTCQHHDVDTTRPGMRCRGKADPSAGLPPPLHASTSMLQYRQCAAVERPFLWGQSDERGVALTPPPLSPLSRLHPSLPTDRKLTRRETSRRAQTAPLETNSLCLSIPLLQVVNVSLS